MNLSPFFATLHHRPYFDGKTVIFFHQNRGKVAIQNRGNHAIAPIIITSILKANIIYQFHVTKTMYQ
jgi:hypothetical protein